MSNQYFQFKQFTIRQDKCAMKVCTDACILGAWTAMKARLLSINNILDIGTGTGLLSLMLAQKTNGLITAIEINKDAAEQALENSSASPWSNRIDIVHSSLQDFKPAKNYDLIISNPPFYEYDLRSGDEYKNAAKHDTTLKLEELLFSIREYLNVNGHASVLLPFHRTPYFEEKAKEHSLFVQEKVLVKQTAGHEPFRSILLLTSNCSQDPIITELIIHDSQRNYTEDFILLLKDYYLKL